MMMPRPVREEDVWEVKEEGWYKCESCGIKLYLMRKQVMFRKMPHSSDVDPCRGNIIKIKEDE